MRKSRHAIAVLNGNESDEDLEKLSDDVFMYFGFGCRNVSKIYLPVDFDLKRIFPAFEKKYKWQIDFRNITATETEIQKHIVRKFF